MWSSITSLPHIKTSLATTDTVRGLIWAPKLAGSFGFIIAAIMGAIDLQPHWYRPALRVPLWYITIWKIVGGFGFLAQAIFGFYQTDHATYVSAICGIWGTFGFLSSGVLMLYECIGRYPVEVLRLKDHDEREVV